MEEALISVIIPVYKVEEYLDVCIQSVVKQTYSNLEIILVDDGSPDKCPQMCDEWAKKDTRIRVIHKENGGASSARNMGLSVARGEYIGFVDSDDYISEDMYEILLTAIQSSEKGIADCGVNRVCQNGNIIQHKNRLFKELDVKQSLEAVFTMEIDTAVWCKLYKRFVFEEQRFPEGETNEEFPLIIPGIIKAKGIVQVAECKYFYRERPGSVTSARIPNTKILYKNLCLIQNQLEEYGIVSKNYGFFAAQYAYFHCLSLEKNFNLLTADIRKDYKKYRAIMWKNLIQYLRSPHSILKDKVLYLLILTKLLRPLYKLFYRTHL